MYTRNFVAGKICFLYCGSMKILHILKIKNLLPALFSLFALASCTQQDMPVQVEEQELVADTEPNIITREVDYSSNGITLKGYIAYDENQKEKRPGLLVIHEWWGQNDYVRDRAEMLAAQGYVAMAVDMYGEGKVAQHPGEAMKESGMVVNDMEMATRRFDAAREVLVSDPRVDTTKISAVGYCFGGSIAMAMANDGADLDGVVAFHSGVKLPIMPSKALKAKILVQNGAADPFISEESVADFKAAMDSVGADYEYIAYEGAVHAYTNPGADSLGQKFELPLQYQKKADEESWEKLQKFFRDLYP
jgi:dienelactone hydrolase